MIGIVVDTTIIKLLIKKFKPELSVLIEEKTDYLGDFIGNNFINRGLTNLFSNGMIDRDISLLIWDYLFIEGNIVLFKSFLAIYDYIYKIIKKGEKSLEFYNEIVNKEIKKLTINNEDFIYNLFFKTDKVCGVDFNEYRFYLSLQIADTIEEQNIEHVKSKVKLSYDKNLWDKQMDKTSKCNKKWPYCINDTYFENVTRTVFYTVFHEANSQYIGDYFFSNKNNENIDQKENLENKEIDENSYYNLRVDRRPHYCNQIQNELDLNEKINSNEEDKKETNENENKNIIKEDEKKEETSHINQLIHKVSTKTNFINATKEIERKITMHIINSLEDEE